MASTTFALPVGTVSVNAPGRHQISVALMLDVSDITSVTHELTGPSTSLDGLTTATC